MSLIKNNNKYLAYRDDEPPTKKIVSEADIFIKELATKQQNKNANLQEYLEKKQHFVKLSEHVSFTNCNSGVLSLEKFKIAVQQLEQIQDLKDCNLSSDDVKFILQHKSCASIDKYKNIEPNILVTKVERILQSIKECKDKSDQKCNNNIKSITHKQNESLALKPNSTETKLLKFALENNTFTERIPHPMDNIKSIETNLFSHLHEEKIVPSKVQKQLRRYFNKLNTEIPLSTCSNFDAKKREANCFVEKSKWDLQSKEDEFIIPINIEQKTYMCEPQNYYTIKDGCITKLTQHEKIREVNINKTNRLTVEQLKAIPKFKDFEFGSTTKILYLKNLPKHIRQTDLNRIFAEFNHDDALSFRVLTGRMKGQAFVSFPDEHTASEAMHALNGVLLNNKPLLIQFGKG